MRENGFYWVKDDHLGWVISEWFEDFWRWDGTDFMVGDWCWQEIDERRITRPETP